jgi:hypothetical protein
MPPTPCTPGSCEEGSTCAPNGRCQPETTDGELLTDSRAHVGVVLHGEQAIALGTLVSSRVVLTCKECLGSVDAGALSFAVQSADSGVTVRSLSMHADVDVAALTLERPFTDPPVELATVAPNLQDQYVALIPDPESMTLTRYRADVTIAEVAAQTFSFESPECTGSGGPTFAGNVLYGVHTSADCALATSPYRDTRIDALGEWIRQVVTDAEPETCDDAVPDCPGECADFSCTEGEGGVQTSCTANDDKCAADTFCAPNGFTCKSCEPGTVEDCGECGERTCDDTGTWGECMGKPITLTCGDCGRNYCQLNGDFGGCTAVPALCSAGSSCKAQGSGYSCEQDVTCSTAPYDDYCPLTGQTPPATVNGGSSWLTGHACSSGGCRSCSCSASGVVSCANGCVL